MSKKIDNPTAWCQGCEVSTEHRRILPSTSFAKLTEGWICTKCNAENERVLLQDICFFTDRQLVQFSNAVMTEEDPYNKALAIIAGLIQMTHYENFSISDYAEWDACLEAVKLLRGIN